MALTLGDNFSYQGAKPLDARLKYATVADMKAVADSTIYDGCLAYCTATDKTYQWKSTNTVDTTLGKWREFSSVVVDSAIDSTSENPVQNKVIKTALDDKADLVDGKIPASQLPSYVDDVIDGYYKTADGKFYEESTYETEITPESGKIYISVDTEIQYRWTGSAYSPLGGALTLGETSSTAYRGDRGKTAYDISQTVGDVANLTTTNKSSVVAAINEVKANGLALGETSTTAYRGDRGKTAYDFSQNPSTSNPAMNGTATAGSSTAWSRGDHVHPKDTSKQDVLQYSTMPTAAAGIAGKIIQYIGTSTVAYKNGYFYKCVESSGSYSWQPATVQSAGTGGEIFVGTSAEWDKLTTGEKEAYKIVVIQQVYPIELTVGDQYTINGKTFKVAEDLGNGVYAMQANTSWGKAVWPGYSAAGGATSNDFYNQSIAPYVSVVNTWYNNAVKSMESDDYKYGPYLISYSKAQMSSTGMMGRWNCGGPYVSAMKDFVTTDSNRCWVGAHNSNGWAYVISSTYANNNMQSESFCIAPAFNVDTKKVSIGGSIMTPLDPIAGKIYVYNPTTGNLEARGHTILDNADTEYASRTNLKFGGDIAIADDSTNDATKVTPHRLTSAELQEIVSPLPSGQRTMPVLFDETGAEYVVGWYKRSSDGKKKPVYEKYFTAEKSDFSGQEGQIAHNIANFESVISFEGIATDSTSNHLQRPLCFTYTGSSDTSSVSWYAGVYVNVTNIVLQMGSAFYGNLQDVRIKLQYTKTTDTWE